MVPLKRGNKRYFLKAKKQKGNSKIFCLSRIREFWVLFNEKQTRLSVKLGTTVILPGDIWRASCRTRETQLCQILALTPKMIHFSRFSICYALCHFISLFHEFQCHFQRLKSERIKCLSIRTVHVTSGQNRFNFPDCMLNANWLI